MGEGDIGDMGGFGDTSAPSNPGISGVGNDTSISSDIGDMPDSGTLGMNHGDDLSFDEPMLSQENQNIDMSVDPTDPSLNHKGFLNSLLNFSKGMLPAPIAAALGISQNGLTGQTVGNITQGALAGMFGMPGMLANTVMGSLTGHTLANDIAAVPAMNNSDIAQANAGIADPGNAAGRGLMGNGFGDVVQGLGGMFMGNRSTGQYNDALGSLNSIFSPNSPYAQMMRQQMERKDAASGRRSQYGPRETQLAALLAQHQANTLSSPGYANMMQQRNTMQNQGMNTLLNLLSKNSGRIGNGIQGMMNGGGLDSLFNNGYSNNWNMGANAGPQMPDMGGGSMFGGSGGGFSPPDLGFGEGLWGG